LPKYTRALALFASVAVFAAACSGAGSTTPVPTTAPTASAAASGASGSGAPTGSGLSPEAGTLPAPEKSTVRIGLSATEISQYTAKLAEQLGIFEKHNLAVELTVFEGDGKVMQALQSGQLDIGFGGIAAVITSQTTDVPVVVLSSNATTLTDLLTTTAAVKTADDLRGKCVAVSTFGGTSHGAVILSLRSLGLAPEDVVITEVGGESSRIAALTGGSCAAAPVDGSKREEMAALGFNFLVDLKEEKLPWGRSGMGVTKEWLAANPNTAVVVAASLLEAQNVFWTDPDTAAEKYAEFTQSDLETAKQQVADFVEVGNRTLMWPDEAFENPKQVLATVNPDIANVAVTDAFDRSVLEALKANGYYEFLGVPTE
jgi:NitT/TauT family transport system substrate-binding protein